MTITVLVPNTVELPDAAPAGTRYVSYDVAAPLPEAQLDAEVLVVWGNPDPMLADAARRLGKLRLVQLLSAGSDNADIGHVAALNFASGFMTHRRRFTLLAHRRTQPTMR
jgi:lactate dehydrogenase-like 2-hydroxyacid dehydrogenase